MFLKLCLLHKVRMIFLFLILYGTNFLIFYCRAHMFYDHSSSIIVYESKLLFF